MRGAEEFDELLSGRTGDSQAYADLLEVVASLRALPPVEARPEFVASLRTQLVAAAEREPARADSDLAARLTPRQRRGARERRLAAVIGGFAVVAATGSMAMASQDALPGDVLYPVKRALENAQTNLQSDDASKADTLIAHAESRLDEAEALTARGADADAINATLQDFADQANQASEFSLDDYGTTGKAELIADLRAFARDSMDRLGGLGPIAPAASRPMLITASQTIKQIDASAWEACPSCADGAVTEMPTFALQPLSADLLSGDVPGPASVSDITAPKKPAKPQGQQPTPPADGATDAPLVPPIDVPTPGGTPSPGTIGGTLGNTVKGITNGVGGLTGGGKTGGSKPTDGSTTPPPSLTGTLIDGVSGVLGGLLGTTPK
ncbi:DUF5667 domain-containing protein [Nocardioides ginsengisoli]|uniref:DUF5667 domain-containing protein n=1 Tax=Nocardioides ginsengisoli TaxID=363868 RepID=A0ABW3VZ01_9ACTN